MTRRANIDPVKRAAIWQAHDCRCIYTTEKIDSSELAIDHLIPLEDGDDVVALLKAKGMVAADFDLNGFENLVPAHGPRNRQKSDLVLDEAPLIFFLQLAGKNAPKAKKLYEEMIERDRALNGFLQLQAAAQRNGVTVEGIFEMLKHQNLGDVPIRVPLGVEGEAIYAANSEVAAALMDMPFNLGGASIDEVPLEGPGGDEIVVRTSNEFLAAKAHGYSPMSQYAINVWTMADATSETLKAIRNCCFAVHSEIRFPLVTPATLDRWSSVWITRNAPEGPPAEHLACRSIQDLISAGFAELVCSEQWHVDIRYREGFSTRLSETMRADLDGDGHEEILVNAVAYAVGGTFRAGGAEMAKMEDGLLVPKEVPNFSVATQS